MAKFPQVMLHMDPASKTTQLWHAISFLAAVPASTHVYELVAPKHKAKRSVVPEAQFTLDRIQLSPLVEDARHKDSDALPMAYFILFHNI